MLKNKALAFDLTLVTANSDVHVLGTVECCLGGDQYTGPKRGQDKWERSSDVSPFKAKLHKAVPLENIDED